MEEKENLEETKPAPEPTTVELLAKITSLEESNKMLLEVADKGRVAHYQSRVAGKKPFTVKLSRHDGKYITGWRVVKDQLVKHPTTGLTVGEEQEIEVLLLDDEGKTTKHSFMSYPAFTDARYLERVECEVTSRKEDWDGKWTYELKLPNGRVLSLASQFVN